MTTSIEHYHEAERLLAIAKSLKSDGYHGDQTATVANTVAMAQAHATLALAGATGLNRTRRGNAAADHDAWSRVASVAAATEGNRK